MCRLCCGLVLLWISLAALPARAGYFDCTVVYDEFDQLMNRQFLVEPDRYVAVLRDRLTRQQHLEMQKGRFLLRAERQGLGIAVVTTNQRTHGKLLFSWNPSPIEDSMPVLIEEAILVGSVSDGYAPRRLGPIYVKPATLIDLDSGRATEADDESADLSYQVEGAEMILTPINGASIVFPVESMCHRLGE